MLFKTDKRPLTYLLDQIDQGELALADFQRSFVWEANALARVKVPEAPHDEYLPADEQGPL